MFEDIDDYRVLINLSQRDNLFSDEFGRVKVQLAFCEISAYLASSLPRPTAQKSMSVIPVSVWAQAADVFQDEPFNFSRTGL